MISRPITVLVAALLLFGFFLSPHKLAQGEESLQSQQLKALDMIKDFANSVCKDIPLAGTDSKIELSGDAEIKLNELLKKMAGLKLGGGAKYLSEEYQGLIKSDLIEALKDSTSCKLKIWQDLRKLVPLPSISQETNLSTNNADLGIDIRWPQQAVPILNPQPKYLQETVFCEEVGFHLILSHNQKSKIPIRIERLAIESESIPADSAQPALDCQIDTLNLEPHGIVELNKFTFSLNGESINSRKLMGLKPDEALKVYPSNILETDSKTEVVELTPEGDFAHYEIKASVQAASPGLYRTRFSVGYDVAGQLKEVKSQWLYIFKNH